MGYFEFRDRICRACDAQCYRTVNHKTEKACYIFGTKVAEYAPCLISFFVVLYAALALGIFTAAYNSDLYYQWIEVGSRLIEERQFIQDYHSFSLARTQYIIATGQGPNPEMMEIPTFNKAYEVINLAVGINVTDPTDATFPELGWFNICSRVPMPPLLYGPMRFFGGQGFPCTIYSGFDCFVQGEFNYDVPPSLRAKPGDKNSSLVPYSYPLWPNFTTLTTQEMWHAASGIVNGQKIGSSCLNWANASVPQNFMFGSVSTDSSGVIDGVHSLQMVFLTKTETQLAQWKCVEKCVAAENCLGLMTACAGGCQQTVTNTSGAACAAQLQANATLYGLLQESYLAYCVYGNASTCPSAISATQCGSCYNEPDPLNPVGANCQSCQKALLGASSLPTAGTSLIDFMTACLTPPIAACIQAPGGCFAIGSACEYNCTQTPACLDPPENETAAALTVLLNWENNFMNYMTQISNNYPFKLAYFAERTTDDLVHEAGEADAILIIAGYFAMIAFGCITLIRSDTLQSRLFLGLGGMFLVILSIVGAMGFSALIGITFVPTIVQVLPFLALGLGTYDMFILAFGFQFLPGETVPTMIGELMKECGPRLLLTALTNILVFGIGCNIPLRAVSLFSGAMCIVILFNFLILVIAFSSLIALHAERIHRDKIDCICCFSSTIKHTQISSHHDDHIGWAPLKFAQLAFWWPTKVICIMGAIVIFAVGIWGSFNIEIGLPLSDIVPKDSAAYGFLSAREHSYGSFPSYLFIRLNVNMTDPAVINEILRLENALQTVSGMDPKTPIFATSWLDQFLWYCHDTPACAHNNTDYPNTAIKRVQNGVLQTSTSFWPLSSQFNSWLKTYFTTTSNGPYYNQYVSLNADGSIYTSRINMIQDKLYTDQEIVEFIKNTRKITDGSFVPCFPGGFLYDLYEQYVNVQSEFTSNIGFTAIGVLGISFFFLLHPAAVFINGCMIALTLAECYGFLALFHLKLNGVSVVNLVLAIGLIVVPTEHIVRVFMVTNGTTTDRARRSLAKMVFPMFFSTVSTFLGELPMEFAKFPYFRLYFFYQYVIIGLLTLFNSFLALPYFLEYLGPAPITGPVGYGKADSRSSTTNHHEPIEMPTLEETRGEGEE